MIRAWVWSICDGDVITEDDDIYGDGVNIAARLEPLAELSGIRVSSIVNESIGSRIDACFKDAGDIRVKNINRPIRIRKWHPGAAPDIGKAKGEKPLPNVVTASIAVLPFINMSGDPEQEYFSDGISEDIITDLSKIVGLSVIARNSSFTYKGRSVNIRSVGRELGGQSVLEGSIRRSGGRVRITAQLVDTTNGAHRCPLTEVAARYTDARVASPEQGCPLLSEHYDRVVTCGSRAARSAAQEPPFDSDHSAWPRTSGNVSSPDMHQIK